MACGYNGSVSALKAMGALNMGIAEHELQPIVDAWRTSNPHIVQLWADIDTAAITTRRPVHLHGLTFTAEAGHQIVMHVHDEIVIDEPRNSSTRVVNICQLMTRTSDWAAGLPLAADGYECDYYRKD